MLEIKGLLRFPAVSPEQKHLPVDMALYPRRIKYSTHRILHHM